MFSFLGKICGKILFLLGSACRPEASGEVFLVKQLHAASRACLSSTVCSRNYCEGRQRAASGTHADMAAKLKILYISTHQKQTWNLKIYPQTEKEKDLPKTATFQFHDCFRVYLLCVKKCSFNCRYILLKKC